MTKTRALLTLCALLGSCDDAPPYYKCIKDVECTDFGRRQGRCLTSTYGPFCAYPDSECPTMWRWYDWAHSSIRDECVAPSVPLDAAVDAPADM